MAYYHYKARDKKGNVVRGRVVAESLLSAKKQISQKDLIVIAAKESQFYEIISYFTEYFKSPVPTDDLIMFSRQTQIIYNVGIPILQGMKLILEQTTHPKLRIAIHEMTRDLAEGMQLHQAMTKHGDIFDPVYISLVRVGETTGGLAAMLDRASNLIEERAELNAKIKSATFYPKMVIGFFGVVLLVVLYGILPRLNTFFTNIGSELPMVTRILMGTSDFFVKYWFLVAIAAGFIFWGIKKALAVPEWRYEVDKLMLKLPIFGVLFQQIEVNTFCVILDILLRSGITIVESFIYVEISVKNKAFSRDVAACRDFIEKGGSLTEGLATAETFPSLIKGLIGMGEEGGKLPDVLQQISRFYRVQIDHRINNLSKLIEPILLLFIFGLVLFLALAVFMPMWTMSSAIKR